MSMRKIEQVDTERRPLKGPKVLRNIAACAAVAVAGAAAAEAGYTLYQLNHLTSDDGNIEMGDSIYRGIFDRTRPDDLDLPLLDD